MEARRDDDRGVIIFESHLQSERSPVNAALGLYVAVTSRKAQQSTRTGRSPQTEELVYGCREITLEREVRSPDHRGRLPGLAH
jgi:hypothetical protein